jgi:cytoskeletal protein CcmA (bactofilin family)
LFTGDASGLINFPPGIGGAGTDITLLNQHTASINEKTGSYATTGSNTFEGNQTFNGDITSTGKITADSFEATGDLSGDAVLTGTTNLFLSASLSGRVIISGSRFNLQPLSPSSPSVGGVGSTPSDGDMYFDSTYQTIYFGKNGTWNPIHSGSSGGVGTYSDILDLFIGANPLWDVNYQIVSESNQMARILNSGSLLTSESLNPSAKISNNQLEGPNLTINETPYQFGGTLTSIELLLGTDVISGSDEYNALESSFYSYTGSIDSYTASIESRIGGFNSGSFATTGSNIFVDDQNVLTNIYVGNSIVVTGSVEISELLIVTGSTFLSGSIELTGSVSSTGSFTHYGNFGVNDGNLTANNGLTVNQNLVANGNISLEGNLSLIGSTTANITASNALFTGLFTENGEPTLIVSGGLSVVSEGTPQTSSMVITATGLSGVGRGYILLPHVSESLGFESDALAAAAGVPIGGLYRNGNALAIRID